jgi:predicted DNA-binding protein with PD1-like motif
LYYCVSKRNGKKVCVGEGGNITTMDSKPCLHLHATLSDVSYHAFGGPQTSAVVGGTCETFIHIMDDTLGRRFDTDVGLNVFDLWFF